MILWTVLSIITFPIFGFWSPLAVLGLTFVAAIWWTGFMCWLDNLGGPHKPPVELANPHRGIKPLHDDDLSPEQLAKIRKAQDDAVRSQLWHTGLYH